MSLFANISTDQTIEGAERDSLGGGGFIWESDAYKVEIIHAYITKADSGAMALNLKVKTEDGKERRDTIYFTNKAGQNFFERDGKKAFLPGWNQVSALTKVTTGKLLSELEGDFEEKVIKLYNKDANGEVPTKVIMAMPLLGKTIYMGILKVQKFKQVKGDDGKYVDTDETQEVNEVDKFFAGAAKVDKLTSTEVEAVQAGGAIPSDEDKFFTNWVKKNKGQVIDKTKGKTPQASAGTGKASTAAAQSKPTESLFG